MLLFSTLSQLTSAAPPIAAAEAWLRTAHSRLPYVLAPGISAVVVSGKDVHTFGSGVQKAWPGPFTTPADGNTLYEIGSLSKTMVALGLNRTYCHRNEIPAAVAYAHLAAAQGYPDLRLKARTSR